MNTATQALEAMVVNFGQSGSILELPNDGYYLLRSVKARTSAGILPGCASLTYLGQTQEQAASELTLRYEPRRA